MGPAPMPLCCSAAQGPSCGNSTVQGLEQVAAGSPQPSMLASPTTRAGSAGQGRLPQEQLPEPHYLVGPGPEVPSQRVSLQDHRLAQPGSTHPHM